MKPLFTTEEQTSKLTKAQVVHMLKCAEACLYEQTEKANQLRKVCDMLIEPVAKLVCIDDDGSVISDNKLCDCLHHPTKDQHEDDELCPVVERLGKAVLAYKRLK